MSQTVRLIQGGLSSRIFAVTRYRQRGDGTVEALEKHDVTDEFFALCARLGVQQPEGPK